ncbi:hypothetical protein [Curtobacterium sp. MCBD17_028]|uniref:hypothetical protein n=1 Tax=Curtobacterium sp. MCBD17_028 TaxID=2175670 RepID=UPI001C646D2B|nr:hypothetical protein [Curtobacterium sp. MCBD17_028]
MAISSAGPASSAFRVIERDGDAAQVAIAGVENSPYAVSAELLASISDYPAS